MSYLLEASRQRIEAGISEVAGSEISLPANADIHFFFSSHGSADDMGDLDNLRGLIEGADIVALERAQWNDQFVKGYNRVSSGDYKELQRQREHYQADNDTYNVELSRALYNSKKVIMAMDISDEDPLNRDVDRILREGRSLTRHDLPTADLDGSIKVVLEVEDDWGAAQKYREELILREFGPRLTAVIANHRKLSGQDRVKILVVMGSLHTSIFHNLRKSASTQKVTREFGNGLPIFPGAEVVQRARLLGVELTDEQRRNALLFGLIGIMVRNVYEELNLGLNMPRYDKYRIEAEISRSLSPTSIERLFRESLLTGEDLGDDLQQLVREKTLAAFNAE